MSNYVIIDADKLKLRIEELEEEYKSEPAYQLNNYGDKLIKEIMILKQILSQSTPLIPEIEKAWKDGRDVVEVIGSFPFTSTKYVNKNSQQYISNLKLDI